MKKLFLLLVTFAVIAACNKTETVDIESPEGLKDYYVTDLMAGQNIHVGTVTYVDTETGFFKITYELINGWTMSESHAYAGPLVDMPRAKKKGNPKIGQFPYSTDHNPEVTTYTYTHVFDPWPNPDYLNKFVCAAHAVVNHPTLPSETAWAVGDEFFGSNGGWSSFTNFSDVALLDNIVYGIVYNTDGSIELIYINTLAPSPEIIMTEIVNTSGGEVTAAAFDPNQNLLFFVIGNTLYVNDMNEEGISVAIGTLPGTPIGGAFLNGNFYYLGTDPNTGSTNEIIEVQLSYDETTGTWSFTINYDFSTSMPFNSYLITDMASDGTDIYLVGENIGTGAIDIFVVNVTGSSGSWSGTWSSDVINTQLVGNSQIAFGPDGNLYAVDTDNAGNTQLVSLDIGTGDKDIIDLPPGTSLGNMSDLVSGK
jgi:hypothetical protein